MIFDRGHSIVLLSLTTRTCINIQFVYEVLEGIGTKMRAATPLQRQWHILISLMSRRQGMTIKEMAQEANVPERTIFRDLKSLKSLGFRLEERTSDHGRKHWQFIDKTGKVRIQFTWSEAVALYLGRQLLDPLAGTYFWQSAQSAFAKIRTMLDENALSQLDKMSRGFLQISPGRTDYSEKADLIDRLTLAIEERRVIFLVYQSERATEPVSLEVYPYGLVYHNGWLYLVAHSRDHEMAAEESHGSQKEPEAGTSEPSARKRKSKSTTIPEASNGSPTSSSAFRTFKVDRVSDVDVQTLQFTPDPSFQLENYFSNSFGIFRGDPNQTQTPIRVRVHFAKGIARYVGEKTWHAGQTLEPQKDGSTILEVSLGNTKEFKSWVLGFGAKATVLEPQSLREEIVDDLKRMLSTYSTDGWADKVSMKVKSK